MPLDPALLQTAAAFTPAIFEAADQRVPAMLTQPIARIYMGGPGTSVLDEVSEDPLRKYLADAVALSGC